MDTVVKSFHFVTEYPILQTLFWLGVLIFMAVLANFIVRHVLLQIFYRVLSVIDRGKLPEIRTAIGYLANIVPTLVIYNGIGAIPGLPPKFITVVQNVSNAFTIFVIALAVSAILSFLERFYHSYNAYRRKGSSRSIKGIVQVVKIIVFLIAIVLIIAALIDKSPLVLLSGLGAMAAVLILVSQDTLLSFIAGIQLSTTDMVRVGDWITVPSLNADGDVVDIALHTVKIQNFDKTITSVPTRKLVTDSFINWRGMRESGGRRIKRAINIDQTGIHFLTDADYEKLSEHRALRDYIQAKQKEIADWNSNLTKNKDLVASARRLTNIGTFRAYILAYLGHHPSIRKDLTLMVRQLAPTPTGLPLEIYCFTNTVVWPEYEAIQSDIFDHLYSVMPTFGLSAFQETSGNFTKLVAAEPIPVVNVTRKK